MGFFDFVRDLFNPVKKPPPDVPEKPGSSGAPLEAMKQPSRMAPATPQNPSALKAGLRLPPEKPRPLAAGLPPIATLEDLCRVCGTSAPRLTWLALEKGKHYATWKIPKARGHRIIEAPKRELRAVQRRIHEQILARVPVSDAAHGFRSGRSPVTNAQPHIGKCLILKLDLRDFFWQVRWKRVSGLFHSLGYSRDISRYLWRLCCHNGRLPQGAPTSPAITNLCCLRLDARLSAFAKALDFAYTRYADDLTFSFKKAQKPVAEIFKVIRGVVHEEGFALAREKDRFLRAGSRQSVTGVTVNRKISPPRSEVRALRALLHDARLNGPARANRAEIPHFREHVRGRIEAVRAVDRAKGEKLLAEYRRVAWQ